MKKIISLVLVVVVSLSLFACTNTQSANTTTTQTQTQTEVANKPQFSTDPLEKGWTMGKFGYYEPPMEQRNYTIDGEKWDDRYQVRIHDDKYGDLDVMYNEANGKRSIFKAGQSASGRLAVFGKDVKKSTSEMLQDLKEGDAIADAFGK